MPLVTIGKKWSVESAGTNSNNISKERAREPRGKTEHQEGPIDILEAAFQVDQAGEGGIAINSHFHLLSALIDKIKKGPGHKGKSGRRGATMEAFL